MKAFLISAENQSIEVIDLQSDKEIATLIGFSCIENDEVGNDGDRLFFDEECFIRGTPGRFRLDSLVPVQGIAIIARLGDTGQLIDSELSLEELTSRIQYL